MEHQVINRTWFGGYRERPDFFQEGNQLNIQSIDTPDEGQTQVVKAHEQMIRDAEASDDASTEEEQTKSRSLQQSQRLKKKKEKNKINLHHHLKHQFQIKLLKR